MALTEDDFEALGDLPSGRQDVVLFCFDMVTMQMTWSQFGIVLLNSISMTKYVAIELEKIPFDVTITCHLKRIASFLGVPRKLNVQRVQKNLP